MCLAHVHRAEADALLFRRFGVEALPTVFILRGSDHGHRGVRREKPRSATAVVEGGPARVLALRGEALTSILNDRPAVSLAMLTSLAERLSSLA